MISRVARNAAWIILCKVIQSILSLVVSMLTARYLGPSNFGTINYAASLVAFFVPVMYLGLNSILVQEIINHPDKQGTILGTSIFMSIVSSLLCIVGLISFVNIANRGEQDTIIVCGLYSILLVFRAIDLLQYWFQAKLMSKYTSIAMLVSYIIVSAYKIFLLATQKSIFWFAVSNALDFFLIAAFLLVTYRIISSDSLKIDLSLVPKLFRRSKYYIISNLMVVVFTQTDKVMLKIMLDDSATGFYSAAVTCAGMTAFVFSAIIDSFRPSVFANKQISNDAFESSLVKLYAIIIWLSIIQSVFMTILAKPIIFILYGKDFLQSIGLLQIVVWYSTFSYIGSVRGVWMLAEEKQKYLLNINICGALMNVILNFLLIPQYGAIGAAVASLITQFTTNFILGYIIKPIRSNNKLIIKGFDPRTILSIIKTILS